MEGVGGGSLRRVLLLGGAREGGSSGRKADRRGEYDGEETKRVLGCIKVDRAEMRV
jgi:hypothetical protein